MNSKTNTDNGNTPRSGAGNTEAVKVGDVSMTFGGNRDRTLSGHLLALSDIMHSKGDDTINTPTKSYKRPAASEKDSLAKVSMKAKSPGNGVVVIDCDSVPLMSATPGSGSVSVSPTASVASTASSAIGPLRRTLSQILQVPRDKHSFDDLRDIEELRRQMLRRSFAGNFSIFSLKGTLVSYVLRSYELYVALIIFTVTIYVDSDQVMGGSYKFQPIPLNAVTIIGGLESFLIVFFISQMYARFNAQYDMSMAMTGHIAKLAFQIRNAFPQVTRHRLWRFMNAAHILGYVGISDVYNASNFLGPLNDEWQLLSNKEMKVLIDIGIDNGSACVNVMFTWISEIISEEHSKGAISDLKRQDLMLNAFQLRDAIQRIFHFADQPVPYPYIHFLYWMSTLYIPFFAYGCALSFRAEEKYNFHIIIGYFAVLINTVYILALQALGQKFQDPYGTDLEDLSVLHYVNSALKSSFRTISSDSITNIVSDNYERETYTLLKEKLA